MAIQLRQIGGQLGEHLGVEGYPTGIDFTANPVGCICIGAIKTLLGLRVKQFGRVLVPFSAGYAALGLPFLGRGQPADDKGGARWAKKGGFDTTTRSQRAVVFFGAGFFSACGHADRGGGIPWKRAFEFPILCRSSGLMVGST